MTTPIFRSYVYRVGGLAAIYLISILLTKKFLPGSEFIAVVIVTLLVFLFPLFKKILNAGLKK